MDPFQLLVLFSMIFGTVVLMILVVRFGHAFQKYVVHLATELIIELLSPSQTGRTISLPK